MVSAKKVKPSGGVSEGNILLEQRDSTTFLQKVFNPFALRTFGELRQAEANPALSYFHSTTHEILKTIVHTSKREHGNVYKHKSSSATSHNVALTLFDTIRNLRSDKEQRYVASVLAIAKPDVEKMWNEYDERMVKLMDIDKVCSIDTGLLANHAIFTTGTDLKKMRLRKTPAALMKMIIRRRNQLVQEKIKANVFTFAAQCNQLAPTEVTLPTMVEEFPPTEKPKTRDSEELERLGLIMQLLASPAINPPKSPQERIDYNLVALEATEYGVKVISALKAPAPLSALKVVWTHALKCNLPNAYLFHKTFFEQVLCSLTAAPQQLVGDEEAVASLLQSMISSKFKSSALTAKLFELYSKRGFDFDKIGLKLFGSLVELKALSFASSIMNAWVDRSEAHFDALADGAKDTLWIGETGIKIVCDVLAKKTSYGYGDLAVIVTNCGRPEYKNMVHLKLLRDVEDAMTKEISELPLPKILVLLRVYAVAGRNYPPIVEQLCERVHQHVDEMSIPSLSGALWAAARLNLRHTSFVNAGLARAVDSVTSRSKLSNNQTHEVLMLMWTLSVLRKLDLNTFASFKSLLERHLSTDIGSVPVLSQVWVEAQTLMREQGIDEQEWLSKNTCKRAVGEVLNQHVRALPWHSGKIHMSEQGTIKTSLAHLDLSQTLTKMGVPHENEVTLSNGYVADIFIPIGALEEIPSNEADAEVAEQNEDAGDYEVSFADCKGVVVEFDGPYHFESYKRVSYICCSYCYLTNCTLATTVVCMQWWIYKLLTLYICQFLFFLYVNYRRS